jgi:putative FmdB family regulatory protein
MPLYDFQCRACGTIFEIERPLGASGKVKCSLCGSVRTDKMFSAAGIVFKGSGFYVTDSKSSGGSASIPAGSAGGEGRESGGNSDARSQADKPAEAKPQKPAESKPDKPAREKKPA